MSDALSTLEAADFEPVVKLNEVWKRAPFHVEALHAPERKRILAQFSRIQAGGASAGCVVRGTAGAGKTHLIGSLRQAIFDQPEFRGATFLYADMWALGPGNFRKVLLSRTLSSLMLPSRDGERYLQFQNLLLHMLRYTGRTESAADSYLRILEASETDWIERDVVKICSALKKNFGVIPGSVRDVLKALFALNCSDERADFAQTWLRGDASEKQHQERLGLSVAQIKPEELFSALVWLLHLRGTVFLAVDQVDSVARESSSVPLSVVTELVNGLASIVSGVPGILVLLALFMDSWENIQKNSQASDLARFSGQETLGPLPDEAAARMLVAGRMGKAARDTGFTLPYLTWPFRPEAFADYLVSPRELLTRCARHRERCLRRNELTELDAFTMAIPSEVPAPGRLGERFDAFRAAIDPEGMLAEEREDELGELIEFACTMLLLENPPSEGRDAFVIRQEHSKKGIRPLHALIEWGGGAKYYAFRVLQKTLHSAYGPRLKAAMEASGLVRGIASRRLVVFRSAPLPETPKMADLTRSFEDEGGCFSALAKDNVALLLALKKMMEERQPGFDAWIATRRPVSSSGLFDAVLDSLKADLAPASLSLPAPGKRISRENPAPEKNVSNPFPSAPASVKDYAKRILDRVVPSDDVIELKPDRRELLLGLSSSFVGQIGGASLPLRELSSPAFILAGSGGGRTVLLRRIVEQSALCGIPSVVLDNRGDLSRMGEKWTSPPGTWTAGDGERAARYFENTEIVVLTPRASRDRSPELLGLPDDARELLQSRGGRTRVSVLNLNELEAPEHKRMFLEWLTDGLFSIRRKASPSGSPAALLAIDDAYSLLLPGSDLPRMVAHGADAGIGIVLTERQLTDTDYDALNGTETYFLGRARSPQAITKLESMIRTWGGTPGKVPHLKPGEFLMRSPNVAPIPLKISVSMCYSVHGDLPEEKK